MIGYGSSSCPSFPGSALWITRLPGLYVSFLDCTSTHNPILLDQPTTAHWGLHPDGLKCTVIISIQLRPMSTASRSHPRSLEKQSTAQHSTMQMAIIDMWQALRETSEDTCNMKSVKHPPLLTLHLRVGNQAKGLNDHLTHQLADM